MKFKKYERTPRIYVPEYGHIGKHELNEEEKKKLLSANIIVEEKIDGVNVGIVGTKKSYWLQKGGSLIDIGEHPQYGRFKAWAAKRVDTWKYILPKKWIVYGEFMWATHHIYYNQLPDWFICFDIWNADKEKYARRVEKEVWCKNLGIECVPLVHSGKIDSFEELIEMSKGPSAYSSDQQREGIVAKNWGIRGKIVRPNFKELTEDGTHWMNRWDSTKINKLKEKDEK